MDKQQKKSSGFYPTPRALVRKLVFDYAKKIEKLPTYIVEPSAGKGDFIIETWNTLIDVKKLKSHQIEKMVQNTILFENDKSIFENLKANVNRWCKEQDLKSRPSQIGSNFLLSESKEFSNLQGEILVVGNPPWDEFTTRKHDGLENLELIRKERLIEKNKYQPMGFKNLYQCFLFEILKNNSENLSLIFVLPRQLLGDLSSQLLREKLLEAGSLSLTVYCNKDEPDYYFESVARTAEILCLEYMRDKKKNLKIRRGFEGTFNSAKPYGVDRSIPCSFGTNVDGLLNRILTSMPLSSWAEDMEVTVKRGGVNYTDSNYKQALNGRKISAYQFEEGKMTDVILNKILPDSTRKLKAAVLKSKDTLSDSMLRITCKDQDVHPYLMLILNSRPVELALRSVISNINLNNFRLLSLPIPQPDERIIAKARKLCLKCYEGKLSWDAASDEIAREIYNLSTSDIEPLKDLFPDRNLDKIAS